MAQHRKNWLLFFGLILAALLSLQAFPIWPTFTLCALVAVVVAVFVLQFRALPTLVGPLFWYEMGRLERRRWTTVVRIGFSLLLLGVLWWVFRGRFPESGTAQTAPIRQMAKFALEVAAAIMATQGFLVFALTPVYLASAVAEDRERGILDGLLITSLLTREIIFGKLFGRLAFMSGIVLTGLPILCITRVWGGVDISFILANYAVTMLTLLSVGSLAILISTVSTDRANAIAVSYIMVILFVVLCLMLPSCSPMRFAYDFERRLAEELEEPVKAPVIRPWTAPSYFAFGAPRARVDASTIALEMLLQSALLHIPVFLIATGCAMRELRRPIREEQARKKRAALLETRTVPSSLRPGAEKTKPPPSNATPTRLPAIGDGNPLLWKEIHFAGGVHSGQQLRNVLTLRRTLVFVAVAGIVAISYKSLLEGIEQAVVWADNYNPILDVIPWLCRIGALLATAIASVVTGFIAVNSVRRERDQCTLECLLLLPVERVEILRAKWLGCVSHSVVLSCLIVGAVAVSFMMGGIGPWSALLVLLTGGVLIAFFAGFGLWLSIASKNGALANLWMALALLLTLSGGWLGLDLSPLYAQWIAGSPWSELANDGFGLRWVLASVVLFGALAGLFWKSACRRFEKMTDFGKM